MAETETEQPLLFDYLTMQTEWRDYLADNGYADKPALVAELVKLHSLMFASRLHNQWGVVWDDLEGAFAISEMFASVMEPPGPFEVDEVWSRIFDILVDNIEPIERDLASPEV